MSYAIDIYRKQLRPVKSIFDFGFYVSFFPQLVAGPIVRASEFIPQIYQPYSVTKKEFGLALFWIINGLLKKFLLADYIAVNFIDRVFDNPVMFSGFENLMALYGYSLQVYADFSGYTDIAIGIALMLGFRLPKNFNSPYKADNCGEFWKRWHISLSSWLKDYLYIPMGGNRGGSIFSYVALSMIVIFIYLISGSLALLFGIISWFFTL
jgi:D-alanyl-lipoteichoic acid acyltransferase DltB (MBOAT superfamily)